MMSEEGITRKIASRFFKSIQRRSTQQFLVGTLTSLLVLGVIIFPLATPTPPGGGSAAGPALSSPTINNSATTLTLPSGSQWYLYGFATGGANTASGFANGPFTTVTNNLGYMTAGLASTTSNVNSYSTSTATKDISGVAINGFASMTSSFGSGVSAPSDNGPTWVASASDTFSVSTSGSLVVFVALTGGEECLTLTGPSGLTVDASDTQQNSAALAIAHDVLSPGTYTVTESTSACGTTSPGMSGDLIGVFVFTPSSSSTTGSSTTTATTTVTTTVTTTTTKTATSVSTTTVSTGGTTTVTTTATTTVKTGSGSYDLVTATYDPGSGLWVAEVGGLGYTTAFVYFNHAAVLSSPVAIWEGNSFTAGSSSTFAGAPSCSGFDYPAAAVSIPSYSGLTCIAVPGETSGVIEVPIGALYLAVANAGPSAQVQFYLTS